MPHDPNQHHPLLNSARPPAPGAVATGPLEAGAKVEVTLRLRRRPDASAPPAPGAESGTPAKSRRYSTREEYEAKYGASAEDIDAVKAFAKAHGLTVTDADAGRRTAMLAGAADKINAAFGVELQRFHSPGLDYVGHAGLASIPAGLADIVESVHGLDTRPLAQPLTRQATPDQATTPLLPAQVARLYAVPTNSAAGQTIGILEFGGGYLVSDVQDYFTNIAKLPVPNVSFVGIDGATNSPGASADTEVILDIAVAGSVAPGAKIVVYFAPNNEKGWMDAVTTAIHDKTNKPTALSISWGGGESGWASSAAAMSAAFAEASPLGVSVFASSGDGGSGSPAEVLYPASDPNLSGCGGVTISNVSGTSFTQTAWGGSGGGVSNVFAQPSWQSWAGVPASVNPAGHIGRGVPDIAGNADPASGYQLILKGASIGVWGGTSAVAPFYAGVVAVLNAALGAPLGFLNGNLYAFEGPFVFGDITSGSNGSYSAKPGWDAVTGLGSINGGAMETALLGIGLPPALAVFDNKLFMAWKGVEFDERIFFTTYNGSAWAPQTQVPNVATSAGVSLAVFDNVLYMAWKGEGNDQGIWWSTYNGSAWAPQKEVPNVASSTGPRLAVFDNKLFMAWKGMEDDQRLWWSSFNGTTWAAQQQIPGVASSVGPALVVLGSSLVAAWKGEFGDPGLWYSTFNGSTWTPQKEVVGPGTSEGPSLAIYNNELFAAWKGEYADQSLWYAAYNGSVWTPQKQIPGVWSSIGPSIAPFGGKLFAVWKGMSGDERIWFTAYNGSTWAAQQIVPGVGTSNDLIVEAAA
jgi:kumamolisin